MKKILIPMIALAAAVSAPAQIKQYWSNKLADPMNAYKARGLAIAPDGITYSATSYAGTLSRVSAYDGFGNRLWTTQLPILQSEGMVLKCDSNGVPIVAASTSGMVYLFKLNRADGSLAWQAPIDSASSVCDLEIDGNGNAIIAYVSLTDYCAKVRKYSPAGAPLFTTSTGLPFNNPRMLSVAANGQIYLSFSDQKSLNEVMALTPNGTIRWAQSWVNVSGFYPSFYPVYSWILCDRNGRAFAVERDGNEPRKFQVRTFANDGSFQLQVLTDSEDSYDMKPAIDADSRLVLARTVTTSGNPHINVDWFATSASGVTKLSMSKASLTPGLNPSIAGVMCDAFGQAYVYGYEYVQNQQQAKVWAFDSSKPNAIWSLSDINGLAEYSYCYGAVGRWGQVAVSSTLAGNKSADSIFNVKQLGFRNMLINGSSFTGGRTITGTANFYSSDEADRPVALASNTTYATVALSTTVAQGDSQGTFSVELKPTAVRRAVRIDGTYNGTTRSVVFYLEPPVASSLTLFPTTIQGGKKVSATARLNGDAPVGGINVALASNNAAATVPASVTVLEGNITQGFQVQTKTVSQTTNATLSATTGSVTKTATLTITP